jgi:hypothetical protein
MYSNDIILGNIAGKTTKYRRSRAGVSARDKQNIPVYVGTLHFFFNRIINKVAMFPNTPAIQRVVAITNIVPCRIISSESCTGSKRDVCSELFCIDLSPFNVLFTYVPPGGYISEVWFSVNVAGVVVDKGSVSSL